MARALRVLIVDDNAVNRVVACRFLQRLGCDVVEAVDGKQALDKLGTESFDLVFMDCQMPVMDGYETTQLIRGRNWPPAAIPIIALTANGQPSNRCRCLEAGMNDFLAKPVRLQDFSLALKRWGQAGAAD